MRVFRYVADQCQLRRSLTSLRVIATPFPPPTPTTPTLNTTLTEHKFVWGWGVDNPWGLGYNKCIPIRGVCQVGIRVLAFDPGYSTGWALIESGADGSAQGAKALEWGTLEHSRQVYKGENPMAPAIESLMLRGDPDYLTIENFVGSGQRSESMVFTMNFVGYLMAYAHTHGYKPVLQTPAQRKTWMKQATNLTGAGFNPNNAKAIGKLRHAADAAAHALHRIDRAFKTGGKR